MESLKIDLGGGRNPKVGYKCVDAVSEAEYRCNFENEPLPFNDESVDEIYSNHTFEHIENIIFLMNECWRVMKWDAKMVIVVPHSDCVVAWQDPTHKRFFNTQTMKYFCGEYLNKYKLNYGIKCAFMLLPIEVISDKASVLNEDKVHLKQIIFTLVKNKEHYLKHKPKYMEETRMIGYMEETRMIGKELMEKINGIHKDYLQQIHELFKKKNSDYGNAFFKLNSKDNLYPVFMDIQRKFIRLQAIVEKQQQGEKLEVKDETITDTLLDLGNYAVMTATLIKLGEEDVRQS
jgi:SAM-dependent methyltransferase